VEVLLLRKAKQTIGEEYSAGTKMNCNAKRGTALGGLRPSPLYLGKGFSDTFFRAYRFGPFAKRICWFICEFDIDLI
jgi:hypothetical protein